MKYNFQSCLSSYQRKGQKLINIVLLMTHEADTYLWILIFSNKVMDDIDKELKVKNSLILMSRIYNKI